MKKFFKDYLFLWEESFGFMKEHWFGCIVLNVVATLGMLMYYGICYELWAFDWMETIWNKLTGVFTKA